MPGYNKARYQNDPKYREVIKQQVTKYRKKNFITLRKYGLNPITFKELLDSQKHCCAICRVYLSTWRRFRKNRVCIDHDHETGKVRGLLCTNCNFGLGHIKTIKLLKKAITYLEKAG